MKKREIQSKRNLENLFNNFIFLLLYKLFICVYNLHQYLEAFNSPQKKPLQGKQSRYEK